MTTERKDDGVIGALAQRPRRLPDALQVLLRHRLIEGR